MEARWYCGTDGGVVFEVFQGKRHDFFYHFWLIGRLSSVAASILKKCITWPRYSSISLKFKADFGCNAITVPSATAIFHGIIFVMVVFKA